MNRSGAATAGRGSRRRRGGGGGRRGERTPKSVADLDAEMEVRICTTTHFVLFYLINILEQDYTAANAPAAVAPAAVAPATATV